jgi:tRNA nucleotidyltransferase/poly(A) polymerase
MSSQTLLPSWLLSILLEVSPEVDVWLVGGALRNHLLGLESVDYDFVVKEDARSLARRVANSIGANYYDLDSERDSGRVLLLNDQNLEVNLDFACIRGLDIQEDLRARDFTINAMAIQIPRIDQVIDPTGGVQDLKDKVLRICDPTAIEDDPIRALRASRLVIQYNLSIEPETLSAIREGSHHISNTSSERLRDELFRIFNLPFPGRVLRLLDQISLIEVLFPELGALRGLAQPLPHEFDAWKHTLSVIDHLGTILAGLGRQHDVEVSSEMVIGEITYRLGRFRDQINNHLEMQLSHGRTIRQLLYLGALFHDAGKPASYKRFDDRIRFIGHEQVGSAIMATKASELRLSNTEVRWLQELVLNHLRPELLEREPELSRRAIYRFLNSSQDASSEVVLLSLADVLGKQTPPINQELLSKRVGIARTLLEAYFESSHEEYHPVPLIKGDEIVRELNISPGPEIGRLLEALKEAQALKEVKTKADARDFIRSIFKETKESDQPQM